MTELTLEQVTQSCLDQVHVFPEEVPLVVHLPGFEHVMLTVATLPMAVAAFEALQVLLKSNAKA